MSGGNQSDCCGGLKFPAQPHLHAEDCPTRSPDYRGLVLYRENPNERQQFDFGVRLYEGDPLRAIASALDTWGRMQQGGSYSEQCFIMANECLKAAAELKRRRPDPNSIAAHGWIELATSDDFHFKNGQQVLGKLQTGEVIIVWWEDKVDYKHTCDTDTYKPGWVTGERHPHATRDGEGRSIGGKYVTYGITHVREIPE
jgi:hypothetical protein